MSGAGLCAGCEHPRADHKPTHCDACYRIALREIVCYREVCRKYFVLSGELYDIAEGVVPDHPHSFGWEPAGTYSEDGLAGLYCSFWWMLPPSSPRYKHGRRRQCPLAYDMDVIVTKFDEWAASTNPATSEQTETEEI